MSRQETYLFAGGGTGGHLAPGLAVAEELRRRHPGASIAFVVSGREVERRMLKTAGYSSICLATPGGSAIRNSPWQFAQEMARTTAHAMRLMQECRPQVVVGLGGMASVPMVLAAWRCGVPTLLLEQNVVPGKANRWLGRFATMTCLSFAESVERLSSRTNFHVTGNPVRQSVIAASGETSEWRERVRGMKETVLLVLGGSQGAESINRAMSLLAERYPSLFRHCRIVHQVGRRPREPVCSAYRKSGAKAKVVGFLDEPHRWYRRATLVVGRAGATTLAELAVVGVPAIVVPYPHAADNHQWHNAQWYARRGAVRIVREAATAEVTVLRLLPVLAELLQDAEARLRLAGRMRRLGVRDAAGQVVDWLESFSAGAVLRAG